MLFTPLSNEPPNIVTSSLKINKVNTAILIYILWQSSISYSNKAKVKIAQDP